MRSWPIGFLGIVAALAGAPAAKAIPVDTLLSDFNVIVDQNFTMNGPDVEGPVLVGGNLATGSANLNSMAVIPLPVPIAGLGQVNIFGNVTSPSIPIVGSGSVVLVGGTNTTATFPGHNATLSVLNTHNFSPINFATDIWSPLTTLSSTLATLPPNTTPSIFDPTTGIFTFHPDDGLAVVTVTGSQLATHVGPLTFDGLPATPGGLAVINVTGNYTDPGGAYNAGAKQPNVLWNFEGTSVTLATWGASLLATEPNAQLTDTGGDITGDVVATNFTTSAEVHINFPDATPQPPPVVPEPGSLALLVAALTPFALLQWHRRRHS
jgi:choice-of-anchor A domain-containing protein